MKSVGEETTPTNGRARRASDAAPVGPHPRLGRILVVEDERRRFEVTLKGRPVSLTPKEFGLLAILAGEPGRVFGREELLDLVWGREGFFEPRTVDVHLARLRAKFVAAKLSPPDVETVRGVGYRFREPGKRSP